LKKNSSFGIWKYILLAGGVFLLCRAIEIVALQSIGEKSHGIIQLVTEKPHLHGKTYEVYYEFKTEDQSLIGGVDSLGRKVGKYNSVPVRYLPGYPRVNRIDMTPAAYFLLIGFYGVSGVVMLAFGVGALMAGSRKRDTAEMPGFGPAPTEQGVSLKPLFPISVAVLLGLLGYGLDVPGLFGFAHRSPQERTPVAPAGDPGNLQGNLNNGGYFASGGGWIYFVDTAGNPNRGGHAIYKMKPDGSEFGKVADGPAQYLNLLGGTLYYMKWDSGQGDRICRVAAGSAEARRILKDRVMCLHVQGDWLYFTDEYDNSKLYRARLDGTGKEKLNNDVCRFVNVVGQWIYYANEADGMRLYRMKTNGAERAPLGRVAIQELVVQGDWAYFRNLSDGGRLYRIRTDGTGCAKLSDADAHWLNTDGQWLYYSDYGDKGRLHRMPLSGGKAQRLTDQGIVNLHILDGWLYFGVGGMLDPRPYRLKIGQAPAIPEPLPYPGAPPKSDT
jgi:Domain of unknown function (DUF5050)